MQSLTRIARLTGLSYLGLAITGGLGFLLIRQQLFVPSDPTATLANLIALEGTARAGVALELGVVLTQAAVALLFFKLFRSVDSSAAGAVAVFGLLNAVAILCSAALLGTAVAVATGPATSGAEAFATMPQLLYVISDNFWSVGNQFFGLWLIPMGWLVLKSTWMPRPLGWLLIGGGGAYMLSGFLSYLAPSATLIIDALVIPATVGEFWMMGYLLITGVRRHASLTRAAPGQLPART